MPESARFVALATYFTIGTSSMLNQAILAVIFIAGSNWTVRHRIKNKTGLIARD